MNDFEEGYAFFEKQIGAQFAGMAGGEYVGRVADEIKYLIEDLNAFDGYQTLPDKLKGDIAEFWHADTFNINAVARDSSHRAFVDRSHDFASPDISTNFEKVFGLKYYKDGVSSAQAQAKSIFERFREYQYGGGKDSIEEFLAKRGYDTDTVLSDPIYSGQIRIIPKEQLELACQWLEQKIAKESVIRPEQVKRYQETLELLRNKVEDGAGTESISLTDADSKMLAIFAKKGDVTAELLQQMGISPDQIIKYEYLIQQACRAGITAATISLILNVVPEVFKAIQFLIKNGEVDEYQFRKIGFAAVKGGAEGFVRGTMSAAITVACKSGMLGEGLKEVSPSLVGMTVVLTLNTMENAFHVATGKMSRLELADAITKDIFVSAATFGAGIVGQELIKIPVLGYMMGSFIGSMAGSFAYTFSKNAVLSLCVDTGFTVFGLVEQNYELPVDVLAAIGIDVFEYDRFEIDMFKHNQFAFKKFSFNRFEIENCIEIIPLRRGVIGVSKVGYVW